MAIGSMSEGDKYPQHPLQYEDLRIHEPVKTKLVSVVSSDKAFTEEHKARLHFVSLLKEALGDQVDVFGRGIRSFADKRDVLDDYRYHIALENCMIKNYWTEKIADPFLSLTYPIYHGCPNLSDYFPPESFKQINIYEPEKAIQTIKDIISSDLAEERHSELLNAHRLVMTDHNVFGLMAWVSQKIINSKEVVLHLRNNIKFLPKIISLHS